MIATYKLLSTVAVVIFTLQILKDSRTSERTRTYCRYVPVFLENVNLYILG